MTMPVRPAYRLYKWVWTGLDWLYPPACAGCGREGERWCETCQQNSLVLRQPLCKVCGAPLYRAGKCKDCAAHSYQIDAIRCWAAYEGSLRKAILRLKYKRDIALGDSLAVHLIDMLAGLDWRVDLILPVPLSVSRRKVRGYNQASLLARPLAMAMNLDYDISAIQKIRETPSQVSLPLEQRLHNVQNAFRALEKKVAGRSIVLIDDVVTSGATMDACAHALYNAGAKAVSGLALARA